MAHESPDDYDDYDVFINHRGADVTETFAAHLEDALICAGVRVFLDKNSVKKGDHALTDIHHGLNASYVHVAIVSGGYAESQSCLRELVAMLASGKPIIPVLYDIKPYLLNNGYRLGPFRSAFEKHEKEGREREVLKWVKALQELVKIKPMQLEDYKGDQENLKNDIVKRVKTVISSNMQVRVGKYRVGLKFYTRLCVNEFEKMGPIAGAMTLIGKFGVGKTTLAEEIFNYYARMKKYPRMTFLRDVRSAFSEVEVGREGHLVELQNQVLRDLVGVEETSPQDYNHHVFRISWCKVFIVLDNIDSEDQLFKLLPCVHNLGPGSRVILTSRDESMSSVIPTTFRSFQHAVEPLDSYTSLTLFNWHAFGMKTEPEEFQELARNVANACHGLPLALKVVGSSLAGKGTIEDRQIIWSGVVEYLQQNADVMRNMRNEAELKQHVEQAILKLTSRNETLQVEQYPLGFMNTCIYELEEMCGAIDSSCIDTGCGNGDIVKSLELFLKATEECMEGMQKIPSYKFNNEQCNYLVDKLKVVVQSARLLTPVSDIEHQESYSFTNMAGRVEIFKLLLALAKQIESIVEDCCKDAWIQAAMTLTNVSEYVSLIGFNLELLNIVLINERAAIGSLTLNMVGDINRVEVENVQAKASVDADNLFEKVLLELNSLSGENRDLATYLLQRLKRVKMIPSSVIARSFSWSIVEEGSVFGKLFKKLQEIVRVGKSSSGPVHKAVWLGTPVFVKTFYGPEDSGFMREVEILAGLCHPHITSMFCSGIDHRKCSIVMELMDEDLHDLMRRRLDANNNCAPFNILEAVDIMHQVGEGVNYLHNKRIEHRDLKSMNILVKSVKGSDLKFGHVHAKVADFGLSKIRESSIGFSNQTYNTGTNRWMAPEIINLDHLSSLASTSSKKEPKYSFKCDVYSFAMVCYEILTGEVPFSSISNAVAVKKEVLKGGRPDLPDNCPLRLKALIVKCWNQEPMERPTFTSICSELKYLKYLLMTGFIQGFPLPAVESLQQQQKTCHCKLRDSDDPSSGSSSRV